MMAASQARASRYHLSTNLTVELLRAEAVPGGFGLMSDVNPFVVMVVVNAAGEYKGRPRRWPARSNTRAPVWNSTRALFEAAFEEGDRLHIEVFEKKRKNVRTK